MKRILLSLGVAALISAAGVCLADDYSSPAPGSTANTPAATIDNSNTSNIGNTPNTINTGSSTVKVKLENKPSSLGDVFIVINGVKSPLTGDESTISVPQVADKNNLTIQVGTPNGTVSCPAPEVKMNKDAAANAVLTELTVKLKESSNNGSPVTCEKVHAVFDAARNTAPGAM